MSDSNIFDQEWRLPTVLVPAGLQGLLTFRQFKLSEYVDVMPFFGGGNQTLPRFEDDFTLRAVASCANWRPRRNVAECHVTKRPHPVPSRNCTCGFYGSYSSQIIYSPDRLTHPLYCFGATRMYGENLPLAQNGLRASGADVAGILFHPSSRDEVNAQKLMNRLAKEDIFYTFSAREFLKRFPDESYKDILGFDPVKRMSRKGIKIYEARAAKLGPDHWLTRPYSSGFCRPIRPEMLLRRPLHDENTLLLDYFEVYLKPDYQPGGRDYVHPLLEAWGN